VTSNIAESDSWYPEDYWVGEAKSAAYPFRYGDLFHPPVIDQIDLGPKRERDDLIAEEVRDNSWFGALVLSPSCELGAKAKAESRILVGRVSHMRNLRPGDKAKIVTGWSQTNTGKKIAFGKYAYLAPVNYSKSHDEIMFVDFTQTVWINFSDLETQGRIAALDHDARTSLIRREIYYKYRWLVSINEVRAAEVFRISNDSEYIGPKPSWAI